MTVTGLGSLVLKLLFIKGTVSFRCLCNVHNIDELLILEVSIYNVAVGSIVTLD